MRNHFSFYIYRVDKEKPFTFHHLKSIDLNGSMTRVVIKGHELEVSTDLESFKMYLKEPDMIRVEIR